MNLVPKSFSRLGHRSLLKLNGASPTILVVVGVGGLVATAVLASKATRKIDPILDDHKSTRDTIVSATLAERDERKELTRLYMTTSLELTKLYGPTLFVGVTSAVAVLGGHNILRGRQIATMAAYSGLLEQFQNYRKRIAQTLGEDVEKGIYEGARGEWKEDPNHKGEYKLEPVFDKDDTDHYLRPFFDESNINWTRDAQANYLFLKGVQAHMNNLLTYRGHVFLNEVFDALSMPRCREGVVSGWIYNGDGDNYVDFGFMTSINPDSIAFRNGAERSVRLNFNIDGPIWTKI